MLYRVVANKAAAAFIRWDQDECETTKRAGLMGGVMKCIVLPVMIVILRSSTAATPVLPDPVVGRGLAMGKEATPKNSSRLATG